jgi:SAM-dependent methyltransferase
VYIDPQPDDTAPSATADGHLESYYRLPARLRVDWAARFARRGRFLDVGCGTGALVAEALRRGFEVHAVEPDPACAALVERRYGIPVERALIEESKLPAEGFDVVFHVDLLSHFPDPVRALKAMAARLRPGGTMCFEVGLFGGLARSWYPWVGRPGFPAHRWFYSDRALQHLLGRAGLRLVATRTFAIAPSTVVSTVLRRTLSSHLRSVPADDDGTPAVGSRVQRAYARVHHVLRYRLGAVVPLPGPRTALMAARLVGANDVRPLSRTA